MNTGKRGTISGINITPLTDIFLVLLVIMMLLPLIDVRELKINIRPTSNAPEVQSEAKTFGMSVEATGFTINGQALDEGALGDKLKELYATHPGGLVIEVSPESRHEDMAKALSAAHAAKIEKVAIRRIPGAATAPPGAPAATATPGT